MTVPSLIEQWFPASTIGAESLRDGSAAKKPPVNRLHVWWARRPLTTSRAAIVATLLPAWPSDEDLVDNPDLGQVRKGLEAEFPEGEPEYHEWFIRTMGILGDPVAARLAIQAAKETGVRLPDGGYGYNRAFTVTPNDEAIERIRRLARLRVPIDEVPTVLDPFAGGGSIPFEAARFGCHAVAGELNPVAVAILHGTIELPARLGPKFADVIERWGNRWAERVGERLAPYFPKQGHETIAGYIWAHAVPCPTTGLPTPLAPNYWLARGKKKDVAVRLLPDEASGVVRTEVVEGEEAEEFGDRATYKQGTAESVWTGETFSGEYINAEAQAGHLTEILLAISVTRPGVRGRQFRPPADDDREAVQAARAELEDQLPRWEVEGLVPTEDIPSGHKTDEPRRMGLRTWRDLLSPRQFLTQLTALECLREIAVEARDELGDDKSRALALYLGVALDKSVDYNSRLASWHASRTLVRNTFDRHDFSFKWAFAEFDGASALLPWTVSQVVDAYRGISKLVYRERSMFASARASAATIYLGSSTALDFPDESLDAVVTDPPYYDNVMYSELADYFYVWLKRALRDAWPELCEPPLTDKQAEAVANPSLFRDVAGKKKEGGKPAGELADERYEDLLTDSFQEAQRVLKSDGVLTVMFTHKRVDAWDTLGQALLEAGFSIHSSWPVHTESERSLHQAKKNSASSTILLACRKRVTTEPAYWTDIRSEVQRTARESATRFADDGVSGIDLTLSTFGPVLGVVSRNWPVYSGELDDDGNPEILRPDIALDLAREEVARLKKRGLLGGRDVEFDRVTDWYLLAWSDFEAAEFPTGEALKLSIATHLDLDELNKEYKVVRARSGTTTILSPAQRRTAGAVDPDASSFPHLIDGLHALMLLYDEEGMKAAEAFLSRTGLGENPRFRDLVGAALHAIPRVKVKGDFARPEARILEGLRATLFSDIEAPPDPFDEAVTQERLEGISE